MGAVAPEEGRLSDDQWDDVRKRAARCYDRRVRERFRLRAAPAGEDLEDERADDEGEVESAAPEEKTFGIGSRLAAAAAAAAAEADLWSSAVLRELRAGRSIRESCARAYRALALEEPDAPSPGAAREPERVFVAPAEGPARLVDARACQAAVLGFVTTLVGIDKEDAGAVEGPRASEVVRALEPRWTSEAVHVAIASLRGEGKLVRGAGGYLRPPVVNRDLTPFERQRLYVAPTAALAKERTMTAKDAKNGEIQEKCLDAMQDGATSASEVAERAGIAITSAAATLVRFAKTGVAKRTARGRYALVNGHAAPERAPVKTVRAPKPTPRKKEPAPPPADVADPAVRALLEQRGAHEAAIARIDRALAVLQE